MPFFRDSGGDELSALRAAVGVQSPPPPAPTAPPMLTTVPVISTTPGPGNVLQLDVTGQISTSVLPRFGRGSVTVSWPGGASLSSGTVVSHGLPATPTSVMATMGDILGGVSVVCACQVSAIDSSTFTVYAQTLDASTPAAASSVTVYWLALT